MQMEKVKHHKARLAREGYKQKLKLIIKKFLLLSVLYSNHKFMLRNHPSILTFGNNLKNTKTINI